MPDNWGTAYSSYSNTYHANNVDNLQHTWASTSGVQYLYYRSDTSDRGFHLPPNSFRVYVFCCVNNYRIVGYIIKGGAHDFFDTENYIIYDNRGYRLGSSSELETGVSFLHEYLIGPEGRNHLHEDRLL